MNWRAGTRRAQPPWPAHTRRRNDPDLPVSVWISRIEHCRHRVARLGAELDAQWRQHPGIRGAAALDLAEQILDYSDPTLAPDATRPLADLLEQDLAALLATHPECPERFAEEIFARAVADLMARQDPLGQLPEQWAPATRALGQLRRRWLLEHPDVDGAAAALEAAWSSVFNSHLRALLPERPDTLFACWVEHYIRLVAAVEPVACHVAYPFMADDTLNVDLHRLTVRAGLRAECAEAGFGVYPASVAEWLQDGQMPESVLDARSSFISPLPGTPTALDEDQWRFALQLHREAVLRERDGGPYRNPAAAVVAAATA